MSNFQASFLHLLYAKPYECFSSVVAPMEDGE